MIKHTTIFTSAIALAIALPIASTADAANPPFTAEHPLEDLPSGIFPTMQLADVTGDGAVDVVYDGTAMDNTSTLHVLVNDGSGGGWQPRLIDAELTHCTGFTVADMDGDGDNDIVAVGGDRYFTIEGIHWYANDGEGKFWERHVVSNERYNAQALGIADMDGDGDMDIVTARDADMFIMVNPGDDSPWTETTVSAHSANKYIQSLIVGDFDGDGLADIVAIGDDYGELLEFLRNDGGGAFSYNGLDAQLGLSDVKAVDIDKDGDLDLLGMGRRQTLIYENSGSGQFVATEYENTENLLFGAQMRAIDVEGDGDLDIVRARVQGLDGDAVAVLYNDGGSFTNEVILSQWELSSGSGFASRQIDVGDIDCDGDPDFILTGSEQFDNVNEMTWFESNVSSESKGTQCAGGGSGGSGAGGGGGGDQTGAGGGDSSGSTGSGGGDNGNNSGGSGCSTGNGSDGNPWLPLLLGLGLFFGRRNRKS